MAPTKPKALLVRNRSSQSSNTSPVLRQSPPSASQGLLLSPPLSARPSDSLISQSSRTRSSEEDAAFGGFGVGGSRSGDVYSEREGGSSEDGGGGGVLMSPQMLGSPSRRFSGGSYSDSIHSSSAPRGMYSPRFDGGQRDSVSSGFRAASVGMALGAYTDTTSGEKGFSGGGDPYQELGGGSNRDSVGGMSNSPSQALSFTEGKEDDDWMYDEDPKARKGSHGRGTIFTWRGLVNLGCLVVFVLALLMLFAGYPVLTAFRTGGLGKKSTNGAVSFNLGGVNASGQVPQVVGNFGLIDHDTPETAKTRWGIDDASEVYDLIFSDEFNTDGRSFYPGDDPYWEAVDLHYWQTANLEWYSPRRITTAGGALQITLDKFTSHNLSYEGGMMSSWNKFCFTGGYVEVSVMLPGRPDVLGLWPAVWTMGNLGRAGYGGSLEGLWPYSYEACDVGTVLNQSIAGVPGLTATTYGVTAPLSYLLGQRLSACTCPDIDPKNHPGPQNSDGSWVGRAAPEIDIFEAQADWDTLKGELSQSAQWAPFDADYEHNNDSSSIQFIDRTVSKANTYWGGVYQQSVSGVTTIDQTTYERTGGNFGISGFEYKPGFDGYIAYVADGKHAYTMRASAVAGNSKSMISARPVSMEPMYVVINLGISEGFGRVDYDLLEALWPVHMEVDYVRVYQPRNSPTSIGCDPPDHPTKSYIENHPDLYGNPNFTSFGLLPGGAGETFPGNSLLGQC
ncbi:beta-glucan synthesis-associated protein-domain-containing protein [Mrakia frigida]|uniref:beta-glucan synthesis-associated protein-domain-containing protein n=1 Tax=Mrakia frigida TaxID=29902 RepID=UPI003FCBFFE1